MKPIQAFAVILQAVLFVANAEPVTLGQSFHLPDTDIINPFLEGYHIFKPFDRSCYRWEKQRVTVDQRSTFENTESFYKHISTGSKLSVKLTGKYTMGMTLSVKTKSISSGIVDIKGTSIHVYTYANTSYLNDDCFKSSKSQLTDDVMNMFDSLELNIIDPWKANSWTHYDTFLKTFGSHLVTKTYLGATARQWTFSKATAHYTDDQLRIRACVDFAGTTEVGKLNVSACSGVTKDEAESVAHLDTSNYLTIYGGSDETRNKFRSSRSKEDLNQLLNEGRAMQSPVSYEYMAIWEIFKGKFFNDTARYTKAMNLQQYYIGYKDFGCSNLQSRLQSGEVVQLRTFNYSRDSKQELPKFHCILINRGCHSDGDCHIGGAGMVTFCYGNSCFEYKDPAFGFKAKSVVARYSKSGGHADGVNTSCRYKAAFKARCTENYFDKLVIWDGEELRGPHFLPNKGVMKKLWVAQIFS